MTTRDEALLQTYVERALELREAGETVDFAELCREHPDMAPTVAHVLGMARELPAWHGAVRGADSFVGRDLGGRYRLEQRIGAGAMGAVFRATDLQLDRAIAVKVLHVAFADSTQHEERFTREAQVLASLRNDSIVAIHDRGRDAEGIDYLVMELLDGVPMSAVLTAATARMPEGPDPAALASADWLEAALGIRAPETTYVRSVARWGAQLADALDTAHTADVVHRDVKPSNVFLRDNGRACLLDFGIAALVRSAALTATGTSIGTPYYMAPEQVGGAKSAAPAFDVYGLSATLYHLLTLAPPYEGEPTAVLAQIQTEDPLPPARRNRHLPRDLVAIVERGMERDPRRRYPSAAAMVLDLRAFLGHLPVSARPIGRIGRLRRAVRRRPARAIATAAIALLLMVVGIAVPILDAYAGESARHEADELRATIPAMLALEGYPEKRALEDVSERQEAIDLLRRIVALDAGDLPTRLLLASLLLDQRRHADAASEFEELAARAQTPYLRAIANRYARANAERVGVLSVDLSDLPEPTADVDLFVAGFHAMRFRTADSAARALEMLEPVKDCYLPARDLLLPVYLLHADRSRTVQDAQAWGIRAHDAARTLEGVYGRPTARTRHAIGTGLIIQRRYAEAQAPLEDCVELRPGRHAPLQNLAIVHFRRKELEVAMRYLERAHTVRPWLWNTLHTMSRVECARGNFAAALAAAEKIPTTGTMGEATRRPQAIASVHLDAAFAAYRSGEFAAADAAADRAAEWFDHYTAAGGSESRAARSKLLCEAVRTRQFAPLLDHFVAAQLRDPRNATHLMNIASMLPGDGLSPEHVGAVRRLLYGLATHFAPGDPEPAEQLRRLRK